MPRKTHELVVDGRTVSISNPDKILYPAAGFTKAQVIDYYIRVSEWLLPHLRDRPVTLKRYPNGIGGKHFYEKNAPAYTPDWVPTFPVPRRAGGEDIHYVLLNDLPALVWSANLANLEIHPFLHRIPHVERPTMVVFDLDPGEGTNVLDCARVALWIKAVLDDLALQSFVKVSGSKGIQLVVPLNSPAGYDATSAFARALAQLLEQSHPDQVIAKMSRAAREGKVFIDWSQNAIHKTTVSVYSLRAKREEPYVSMPVTWDELSRARKPEALDYAPQTALERLGDTGDLFAPALTLVQQLPSAVATGSGNRRPSRKVRKQG